jgi:hypothetical protein
MRNPRAFAPGPGVIIGIPPIPGMPWLIITIPRLICVSAVRGETKLAV